MNGNNDERYEYEYSKENKTGDSEYVYKTVMDGKQKSRAWSVAAFAVSIASIVCCCYPWVGLAAGVLSIVFAIISRKNIGYFDGLALAGLIVGIFGVVFGISNFVLEYLIENTDYLKEIIEELEKYEQQYGDMTNSF